MGYKSYGSYGNYGGSMSAFRDLWGDARIMGGVSSFLGGSEVSWGTGEGHAKTTYSVDGKPRQILTPTMDELESRGYSEGQCRGLMDHEAAHVRFTKPPAASLGAIPPKGSGWGEVLNILEDARVEDKMAAFLPGCRDNLGELRTKGAEIMAGQMQKFSDHPDPDPLMLMALANSVLGPSRHDPTSWSAVAQEALIKAGVSEPRLSEMMAKLGPAMDMAKDYSTASNTTDVSLLAKRIAKYMLVDPESEEKYKKDHAHSEGNGEEGEGEGGGEGAGEGEEEGEGGGSEGEGGGGGAEGSNKGKTPSDKKGMGKTAPGPKFTMADLIEEAMRNSGVFSEAEKREREGIKELIAKWERSGLGLPIYKLSPDAQRDAMDNSGLHWESANTHPVGQHMGMAQDASWWSSYSDHMDRQEAAADAIVPPIRSMLKMKLLSEGKGHQERHKKRGSLDGSRIHALAAGTSERIFKRVTVGRTKKIHVLLMVDCSGSMNGCKIRDASIAAMAMAKALEGMPGVTHDVCGFTTQDDVFSSTESSRSERLMHWVFKRKGERSVEGLRRLVLGNGCISTRNNVDGESLRWAGRRLMSEKVDRRIMIVFSDGNPAFHFYDHEPPTGPKKRTFRDAGCDDLRSAVKACEGAGIEVIGVGIGDYDGVCQFYEKSILCEDTSTLGRNLLKLLTEVL